MDRRKLIFVRLVSAACPVRLGRGFTAAVLGLMVAASLPFSLFFAPPGGVTTPLNALFLAYTQRLSFAVNMSSDVWRARFYLRVGCYRGPLSHWVGRMQEVRSVSRFGSVWLGVTFLLASALYAFLLYECRRVWLFRWQETESYLRCFYLTRPHLSRWSGGWMGSRSNAEAEREAKAQK